MFCVSCGKPIAPDSRFCEYCGAPQPEPMSPPGPSTAAPPPVQEQPPAPPPPTAEAPAPAPPKPPRKPLPLGAKIGIGVVVAVVVVLVALKVILSSMFTPEKTVNKFLNGVRNQDAGAVRSCATVYMDQLELTDETLAPFLKECSQDNDTLSDWQESLLNDATYLKRGALSPGNGLVRLVAHSNPFFTSYTVELTPAEVVFFSDFDGVMLTFPTLELQVAADEEQTVLLLPGRYPYQFTYIAPETGVDLGYESEVYISDGGPTTYYVPLSYTDIYISASSGVTITGITIDGNPYTGAISNDMTLSPVGTDSEIVVDATAYGIDFQQTLPYGEYSLYVEYTPSEEEEQSYKDLAVTTLSDLLAATLGGNTEAVGRLQAQFPDSSEVEYVANRCQNLLESSYLSGGEFTAIALDEVTEFYTSCYSDYFYIYVDVDLSVTGTWYDTFQTREEPTPLSEDTVEGSVTFKYDGETLELYSYYLNRDW